MKSSLKTSAMVLLAIITLVLTSVRGNDRAADEQGAAAPPASDAETRTFRFTYEAAINELEPGTSARVWVPVAPPNADQVVEVTAIDTPTEAQRTKERRFGNELLYFEAKANDKGEIPFRIEYTVTRRGLSPQQGSPAESLKPEEFLTSSDKVPADGTVLKRFFSDSPPMGSTLKVARLLYDRVDLHMKYDKTGEGWGRGDALWACDSKRGNCSDFHSVFIALCRDLDIPAKFEIGFPLPPEKGKGEIAGYHCWAKFVDGDQWMGVDISEADKHPEKKDFFFGNLPPDRIMLSTERDLILEPRQAAGPVNFLIYPYAEVDGKPYAKQRRKFTFEDVK
jgi:transglutaminase-like putative cysteine protease